MDNKVLDVALQAYMDGWCKSVEGTKRCIATWDDETDVAHARAGVRAAILASLPVLLGEPVAWQLRCGPPDGMCSYSFLFTSEKNATDKAAHYTRDGWAAEVAALYAPSLGEGDGR